MKRLYSAVCQYIEAHAEAARQPPSEPQREGSYATVEDAYTSSENELRMGFNRQDDWWAEERK